MRANLARALDVDIEQDVAAGGHRALERRPRCAITRIEDPRRFRQFVAPKPAIEFLVAHEVIIESVGFVLPRRARGQ